MSGPHLDDDALEAALDGDVAHEAHLADCETCRARIAAARRAWEAISRIPSEVAVPPTVWAGLAPKLRAPRLLGRGLGLAAAALVLFALGYVAGGRSASRQAPPAAAPASSPSENGAAEIQRRGTAYVAALASFTSTDAFANRQARDAAMAALYGASVELVRLDPGDGVAGKVQEVLTTAVPEDSSSRPHPRVRF